MYVSRSLHGSLWKPLYRIYSSITTLVLYSSIGLERSYIFTPCTTVCRSYTLRRDLNLHILLSTKSVCVYYSKHGKHGNNSLYYGITWSAWDLFLLAVVVIIVAKWCNIYIHIKNVRINIFTAYMYHVKNHTNKQKEKG